MRDEDFRENPMVVEAYWYKPRIVAWCDRCGSGIKSDEGQHKIEEETVCQECWYQHIDNVGDDE